MFFGHKKKMACATLKRNLDSTMSMAQLPSKQRRCVPFAASSSTSLGIKMSQTGNSVLGETVSAPAKYTPERMALDICDEIMRLRHRRQFRLASWVVVSCSPSSGRDGDCNPPRPHTKKVHQQVLFTFTQVRANYERMLHDQEPTLCAEYKSVLHTKLEEQYASFVCFNNDQVQRRPPNTCMPLGMDAEHLMHQNLFPAICPNNEG